MDDELLVERELTVLTGRRPQEPRYLPQILQNPTWDRTLDTVLGRLNCGFYF
jgi:hypothetical protein